MSQISVVRRPPLVFRLGAYLTRHGIRGGYRLLAIAERRGWLNKVVRYRLSSAIAFDVPIFRPDNRWDATDVVEYDPLLIDDLSRAVRDAVNPPVFVDCGADIGIVTVLVVANIPRLRRAVAIEPNSEAYEFLEINVSRLPIDAQALHAAVANFDGRGELCSPSYAPSDHSKYLVPASVGDVSVIRIDDLGIEANASVILKLDLEGGEGPALLGAAETLRRAAEFTVVFEAHPAVVRRTGEEPIDIIRFINSIRPCVVTVCDVPGLQVDLDTPLFSQIDSPRTMGYNVLCRSIPDGRTS